MASHRLPWFLAAVLVVSLVPIVHLLTHLSEITPYEHALGKTAPETLVEISKAYQERIRVLEERLTAMEHRLSTQQQQPNPSTKSSSGAAAATWNPHINPLGIPQGRAENLPSIRINDTKVEAKRKIYGGKGDGEHLGGFVELDLHGISPSVWRHMLSEYGIHSLIDVGCGRGISTLWFHLQGLDTLCVEGSHDALEQSMLPNTTELVVEHDFSRGPWWPEKTYDAAWAVEFLEHVGVNYHFNYIKTFRKAAILFVTSSRWGGWHHVEVHTDDWWIRKYRSYGFIYDEHLTAQVRRWASLERLHPNETAPNGEGYYAQHLVVSMKVFINPAVAALPQHAHLFFEHGCFQDRVKGEIVRRPCKANHKRSAESSLPPSFLPLPLNSTAHNEWKRIVASNIQKPEKTRYQKQMERRQNKQEERLRQNQEVVFNNSATTPGYAIG